MNIEPTIVEVQNLVILDQGSYGGNVTFQVIGINNATAPLSVSLDMIRQFAQEVLAIDPVLGKESAPVEPPVVEVPEQFVS